ncbi:hypothetical protein OE88DRAFT_1046425 [Heliocybe sulcata]|uniref:Restriction of telomere capping protein 4 C-terminal domain-containing protein n=1 Tax=Heliocybe sulcata TaxID=5364 RepID=A0A5C3MLS4_9AGAM|nr:hypothetical protein OE88DRAFT_1046425 [Heliocybe sulcata]
MRLDGLSDHEDEVTDANDLYEHVDNDGDHHMFDGDPIGRDGHDHEGEDQVEDDGDAMGGGDGEEPEGGDGNHGEDDDDGEQGDEVNNGRQLSQVGSPFVNWCSSAPPPVPPPANCPECGQAVPANPTPVLVRLLTASTSVEPNSVKGVTLLAELCGRIEFEAVELMNARAQNWPIPSEVDWKELVEMVMSEEVKGHLQAVLPAREKGYVWRKLERHALRGVKEADRDGFDFGKHIRSLGAFQWGLLTENVSSPGYYGDMGRELLHSLLCTMFPARLLGVDILGPFTYTKYIEAILVPEATLAVIMGTHMVPIGPAWRAMQRSIPYGRTAFPSDNGVDPEDLAYEFVARKVTTAAGLRSLFNPAPPASSERPKPRPRSDESKKDLQARYEEAFGKQSDMPNPSPDEATQQPDRQPINAAAELVPGMDHGAQPESTATAQSRKASRSSGRANGIW